MANLKELRGRIKSVISISQITRAMEMVASMKLQKVQGQALNSRPYTNEIRALLEHLAHSVTEEADLRLFQRPTRKPGTAPTTGVFLISSDRGLCGAYNANVLAAVQEFEQELHVKEPERKLKFFVYGRKGYSFLNRRGYDIERFFVEPPLDRMDFGAAKQVSEALVEAFLSGQVDEVRVFYTRFMSVARFVPGQDGFLPIGGIQVGDDSEDAESYKGAQFLLEPDPETIFGQLVPRYLETVIYDAMLQSLAAEHASRRMAMKGATDAASRMSKDLKKVYNRARQESITKELLDIIGGASAVS